MKRSTVCESCLTPTHGAPCPRHPHAELLDEAHDALWIEALRAQRHQKLVRLNAALLIAATVGLLAALGPPGLLLGVLGSVVLTAASRSRSAPPEVNTLLPADDIALPDPSAERQRWLSRRNQRIERQNAREKSAASRVNAAG